MGKLPQMTPLEIRFHQAMLDLHRRCADETGYKATKFLGMVSESGGRAVARTLINASKESSGYAAMWEKNRLDLTAEAVVVENPQWWPLFTDAEIARARKRLADYKYVPVVKAVPQKP